MMDTQNNRDNSGLLFDVFISYAREDQAEALTLSNNLEKEGVRTWLDTKNLKGGEWWKERIPEYIQQSKYFLPLFSDCSIKKSGFVQVEIRAALEKMHTLPPGDIFIIPIRLDDCEIKYPELKNLNRIDLFPDFEVGFEKILRTICPPIKPHILMSGVITVPLGILMSFDPLFRDAVI